MTNRSTGVLPDSRILALMQAGFITGVDPKKINPASIDLPLSGEVFRLRNVGKPSGGERVRDILPRLGAEPFDLAYPLEVGVPYLVRIDGDWKIPASLYAYMNPKSTSGRVNLFSRIITDGTAMYDAAKSDGAKPWEGEMWALVRPDSFRIKLTEGQSVSQARFFNGKAFLDTLEIECGMEKTGLVYSKDRVRLAHHELTTQGDSIMLTLQVDECMGWECRGSQRVLDFGNIKGYEMEDFFQKICSRRGEFEFRRGGFYILSTRERLVVPPEFSAELRPIDVRLGEFRSHAAGFIDAGWGWEGDKDFCGSPITLEFIAFENSVFTDGEVVARVRYEHMIEPPAIPYSNAQSNYVGQNGPKGSKHFK